MKDQTRTYLFYGIDDEVVANPRLLGTTRATDFATAARQLGGEIIVGNTTMFGLDSLTMIGHGEVRIFEPGHCTAEVLAKAVAEDECADGSQEGAALERISGYLHGKRLGYILCTAPEVPAVD